MPRRKKPKIVFLDGPEQVLEETSVEGGTEIRPEEQLPKTAPEGRKSPQIIVAEEENVADAELAETAEEKITPPKIKPEKTVRAEKSAPKPEMEPETEPGTEPEPGLQGEAQYRPARRRPNLILSIGFGVILLVVLAAFIFIPMDENKANGTQAQQPPNCLGIQPSIDWGYALHELRCAEGVLEEGTTLADVLLARRIDYKTIIKLTGEVQRQGLPEIKPGDSYQLLQPPNDPLHPKLLAYAPDPARYVLLNLKGAPEVRIYKRKLLENFMQQSEVAIQTNLAEALYNRENGLDLSRSLEDALKYKIDFFHLTPGDRFSLLYQQRTYEGNRQDIGRLDAVYYRHGGENGYAIWFEDAYTKGYYDLEGRPMRSGFLKAPLEYGRISSPYNLRRPDPVSGSGKIMPHLGTDYAAPEGTPILAVADGVVLKAEFKGGNGNYVKLLHSPEIQTQYLHMRNFAPGIKPGVEVRQGEVIGFVGSTGRSTGPHVCFRYWKNGVQVDHRKEKNLGPAPALKGDSKLNFEMRRDSLMRMFEPV